MQWSCIGFWVQRWHLIVTVMSAQQWHGSFARRASPLYVAHEDYYGMRGSGYRLTCTEL